jgi:hypothetical protein
MDERPVDLAILKTFSPLDGLKAENLHALARKTRFANWTPAGRCSRKATPTNAPSTWFPAKSSCGPTIAHGHHQVRHPEARARWHRVCRESSPRAPRTTSNTS